MHTPRKVPGEKQARKCSEPCAGQDVQQPRGHVLNEDTETQCGTALEQQGAGRGGRNCSISLEEGQTPHHPGSRACGEVMLAPSPLPWDPEGHVTRDQGSRQDKPTLRVSCTVARSQAVLGGAEQHDRHQLKPEDEAQEEASCHPEGDTASEGESPAPVALGTAGKGVALGTVRTRAPQHSPQPPPLPPPLSFGLSPTFSQYPEPADSAPHTPELPPTRPFPLQSSGTARVGLHQWSPGLSRHGQSNTPSCPGEGAGRGTAPAPQHLFTL